MRILWSQPLPAPPLGMSLARETGSVLVWDAEPTLAKYDRLGNRELRQRAPADLLLAAASDDGRGVACAGRKGQVWLLTTDLVPMWERALPRRPVALALDHLGRRVAVADESGGLHIFDREGKERWRGSTARPLSRLAFVPEVGALIGAADFGLVCAFDLTGRCVWRDGLVAHVGDLAVAGDGSLVLLACFTGGLCRYGVEEPKRELLPQAAPARLLGLSYAGDVVVTADLEKTLSVRGSARSAGWAGAVERSLVLPAAPLALAVEALGEGVLCALASGQLVRVGLTHEGVPQ